MSIYNHEIVRTNGELRCYVEVQNEWTGNVRYRLCTIHLKGDDYFCIADGARIILNREVREFIDHETRVRDALKFYDTYLGRV